MERDATPSTSGLEVIRSGRPNLDDRTCSGSSCRHGVIRPGVQACRCRWPTAPRADPSVHTAHPSVMCPSRIQNLARRVLPTITPCLRRGAHDGGAPAVQPELQASLVHKTSRARCAGPTATPTTAVTLAWVARRSRREPRRTSGCLDAALTVAQVTPARHATAASKGEPAPPAGPMENRTPWRSGDKRLATGDSPLAFMRWLAALGPRPCSYPAACTILPASNITASVCCLSADGGGDVAAVATASFSSGASNANCPP